MPEEPRFSIQDLADLADVSRRTVRYYVQEGLLPSPLGVGRGRHYGREHLDRLLQVKALQASGRTLDDIRGGGGPSQHSSASRLLSTPQRSVWRRLELAPGVELLVSGATTMPSPSRLRELAEWCRLHFSATPSDE
jgi:hypothetical protein